MVGRVFGAMRSERISLTRFIGSWRISHELNRRNRQIYTPRSERSIIDETKIQPLT
jgi:hypothetical protein